jgi:NTP pyrophosphatase (non-canonical NTP hydrolase)
MSLREIQKEHYEVSTKKGYTKNWNSHGKIGDIAEVSLIVTEVSELLEELRKHKHNNEHISEECADIVIRVMNFMSRKGLDLEIALYLKNKINAKRKWLHGKAV